jgi:polyphosphate glucokinase
MAPKESTILVIDVGGNHVKVYGTGRKTPVKIPSGPKMTAEQMARLVRKAVSGWDYSAISIGYPGPVIHGRILSDPYNLGPGWVGFDFARAFGCPVKILNDAAMQALGVYQGGRMLFLGLGTGLGSALILDGVLEPMELGHLPFKKKRTYEDYLGQRGLKRLGKKRWRRYVWKIVKHFRKALEVDTIVLGGGNAKLLKKLPPGVRLGCNATALLGGVRLWRGAAHTLSEDTDQVSAIQTGRRTSKPD